MLGTWSGTLSRAESVTAHAGGLSQCRVSKDFELIFGFKVTVYLKQNMVLEN